MYHVEGDYFEGDGAPAPAPAPEIMDTSSM
jgi:hypothetical protein